MKPEIKLLQGQRTFIFMPNGDDKMDLQVHIMRGWDEPEFKYSELKVRAFDETGTEISVVQSVPQEKTFMGQGQCMGMYKLALKKGHRVASVELTRGREKQTFAVTPENSGKPIKLPRLLGQETAISVYREDDKWWLTVLIFRGRDEAGFPYSELKVKAFDESGIEVPVSRADPHLKTFSGRGDVTGKYVLSLENGHRVVSVELTRGVEKQTFAVAHERIEKPAIKN